MTQEPIEKLLEFSRSLKILYAEDNEDARASTAGMLENFFEQITLVNDGREGLDAYVEDPTFDLVITDINMPNMNGIDMISGIREYNRDIPILILSAYNESGYFMETIRLGIEGYLLKPIELEQFVETVQKAVEKIYLKRENETYRENLEQKVEIRTLELQHAYFHDSLTGLQNRQALTANIENMEIGGLILFDLENFSAINDIYGARVGDRILVAVANIMVQMAEDHNTLHRISGDQFAFLITRSCNEACSMEQARRVLDRISHKAVGIEVGGYDVDINVSARASIVYGAPGERLLELADMTLEYAKRNRQDLQVYSESLGLEARYRDDLEAVQMIKVALKEDRIVPFFQPIVKADGLSYECLVRVIDGDKVICPGAFLDAIKRTRYYSEMTRTMIRKSIDAFRGRKENFSLNLSFEDISDRGMLDFITKELTDSQIAERVIFEILETESIDNFDVVRDFIGEMKRLGVKIAIDDFGSGYANFTHLLELRPDYIKIDGSLIRRIDESETSLIITRSIAHFSQEMGIDVIAEYVHSESVCRKVRELNIYGFQGNYIGAAAPEILPVDAKLCGLSG